MKNINYVKTCSDILSALPSRNREVINRRFGLDNRERETLEAIGNDWGITRERVRQIEKNGLLELQERTKKHQDVFQYIQDYIGTCGDLKREDKLFKQLEQKTQEQNHIRFLLILGDSFIRHNDTEDIYSFWTINENSLALAEKIIKVLVKEFEEIQKPLCFEELFQIYEKKITLKEEKFLSSDVLLSFLEISKMIEQGPFAQFGLSDWPEISPKGIKDKAYLVFKKYGKELHFKKVAFLINEMVAAEFPFFKKQTPILPQTVHNELIKDPRFILVGRGIYALKEWGYESGTVKDVILKILKDVSVPLSQEEVIEKVLSQRFVEKNTILLNLQNRDYFERNALGEYILKN
ncbi:MAG: hypothetical protein LRZ96_01490 [Candidatus Pacebacteria bacterium]|nr:hypothetical protein [Candidatus Paceibacterota bacterium]